MSNDLTVQRFPWEPVPVRTVEDDVEALKRDFAYAVANTCIIVHSNNPAFRLIANTKRGQIIPRGECKFTDGTTIEVQDVAMPQVNVPYMTVPEIMTQIWELAAELNLELAK